MLLAFFYRLSAFAVIIQLLFLYWIFYFGGSFFSSPKGSVSQSDIIVILGGGTGDRLQKGIELYKQGFSNRILLTGFPDLSLDAIPSHVKWRLHYLIESGIPDSVITIDGTARSSFEEAVLIKNFLAKNNLNKALIVSDPPHIRRLSYLFSVASNNEKLFSYDLITSNPDWWSEEYWWKNKYAAEFVLMEIIKMVYLFISKFSTLVV